jgi:hypothetical protein
MKPIHVVCYKLVALCIFGLATPLAAQDIAVDEEDIDIGGKEYSPYLYQAHPNRVFWGDTHLHTSYSTDAGMIGNRLGPEEALRFAKGEMVVASSGTRARLIRPLDFLVVADHAENLGLSPMIEESNPELLKDPWGKEVHDLVKAGDSWGAYKKWAEEGVATGTDPMPNPALMRTMWERIIDAVDRHNQPGVFTAFHGFEWTSSPDAKNLHRNVIFRDGAEEARQIIPLSSYDTTDPEDLWEWLAAYEEKTGGRALAIPHGGNLSNGLMFAVETMSGEPIDADYARRRMQWEPIYEVTQIKGDGEAHPLLSPNDEFADYYNWDKGDFGFNAKTPEMLPHEYGRSALKIGLEQHAELGVNPFKFGMIGSTDSHTSLATSREENFFGKFSGVEPGTGEIRYTDVVVTDRRPNNNGEITIRHWESTASGLTGVWARENTREAIWDAMARKEVYATTGTRMLVRVFAGWDFAPDEVHRPDFADQGYQRGVPMGGDLTSAPEEAVPQFMVRALRDPDGANLDRIQIIKGWVGPDGKTEERVYEVAWAGDRELDQDGKLPPVGSTVDVAEATYTNDIGRAVVAGFWEDPDFDPSQPAFYYVRVLEIPTPSWLAYDRKIFGLPLPEGAVLEQQERAYTSPIWYTPG